MKRPFAGLDNRARGRLGEEEAEKFLRRQGYKILRRNFSCRSGEIDVIAEQGGELCFIEIKALATREFGGAIEALTATKRRRITKAASFYLTRHPEDRPSRFDVVAMDLEGSEWRFTLVQNAFEAS